MGRFACFVLLYLRSIDLLGFILFKKSKSDFADKKSERERIFKLGQCRSREVKEKDLWLMEMGLLQFRFQYQYQLSPVKIWFIIITLLTILNINWFVLKKIKNHLTRMLFQPEPIWIQFELIIRFEWFFSFLRTDQLIFKIIRVTIRNHILTRESGLNLDDYSSKPTNPKSDWVYPNPIRIRICSPLISQRIALSFLLLFACITYMQVL